MARPLLRRGEGDVDALEVLALAARMAGRTEEARGLFERIVALDPRARWAWSDLAELLIATGRSDEAAETARAAIAFDETDASAHAILGMLLSEREALIEGAWHLGRAIALAGRHPQLLANLARNLLRQGRLDEAETLAGEAARADPDLLAAAILLAEIAEQRGDLDRALALLDRAEPIARAKGQDVGLIRATILAGGDRWREALALLDGAGALNGAARLLRGRLRERAGRADEAWTDYREGKAALAQVAGRRYDRAAVEAHFAALAQAFPPERWTSLPRAARRSDAPQPIFILGFPRSGTTLVEQLLASHSAIRPGGELPFVAELRDFAQTLLGRGAAFPAGVERLSQAEQHHLPALFRDFYLARAETHGLAAPGAAFFTDKTPLSETYLPLIRLAFPEAPLIVVRRHPLDILVSVMAHDMTHGFGCGYAPEDAAHQLAASRALLRRWRGALGIAAHMFIYEAFVADQTGETARLMAHLGLAPEPAQARFHQNRRHAPTPSYAQVREPVHGRSIGRWRAYADQIAPVLPLLSEVLAEEGYAAS